MITARSPLVVTTPWATADRDRKQGLTGSAMPVTLYRMEQGDASISQLRRGVIEFCVLALLREDERYSFDLVRSLAQSDGLVTSEGTLYPMLGRLRREGKVSSKWRESESGPPRRYYSLTRKGDAALTAFVTEWAKFRDSVDTLLGLGAAS